MGRLSVEGHGHVLQAEPKDAGTGGYLHPQGQRQELVPARRRRQAHLRERTQLDVRPQRRPRARGHDGPPAQPHQGGTGHRGAAAQARPGRGHATGGEGLRLPHHRGQVLRSRHPHPEKETERRQDGTDCRGEDYAMAVEGLEAARRRGHRRAGRARRERRGDARHPGAVRTAL